MLEEWTSRRLLSIPAGRVAAPRALAADDALRAGAPATPSGDLVVEGPAMQSLHRLLGRVAASEASVLLLGEMGPGREVFASQIHHRSPRSAGPDRAIFEAVSRTRVQKLRGGHGGTALEFQSPIPRWAAFRRD